MNVITLKLSDKEIVKLKETFIDNVQDKVPPYANYQLKVENCTITAYNSNKVVFQGIDAEIYASSFMQDKPLNVQNNINTLFEHAGSDEVGTGDYFGPVVVCACILDKNNFDLIKKLKVDDSKKLADEDIIKIAPELMSHLKYSLLILDNTKYNEVHKYNNLNAIKAKLHNKAYLNLLNKASLPNFCIIDQFTPEKSYYNYLKQEPKIFNNLHFETKAESKYPAVACASIIARYAFIKSFEEIEKKYDISLNKGAGAKVDEDIIKFYKRYGFEELNKVAKLHFKNTNIIGGI